MIRGTLQFIAEIKVQSPSGWHSRLSWEELFAIADKSPAADMFSIHTDPRWGGSMELVSRARALTNKPIVAKGIHATDDLVEEAFEAGADYVLVVGRIPGIQPDRCLIEPYTIAELAVLPEGTRAVWNSRDLRKLDQPHDRKSETFKDARAVFGGWLCQASNIKTVADIELGADAVLVGTHLPEFIASIQE